MRMLVLCETLARIFVALNYILKCLEYNDLRDRCLTETHVANWYKNWYKVMQNERDSYLYCLQQIQKEVEYAKKE